MNNDQLDQVGNLKKKDYHGFDVGNLCRPSTRAEFYVNPNGKQKGTGTKEDPFDIVTALSGRKSVQPGDTVWLRGGIYTLSADPRSGKFTIESRLKGTPEKPIIVRLMLGERATVDGALTLAGSDTWYWGIEVRGTRNTTRAEGNDCVTLFSRTTDEND